MIDHEGNILIQRAVFVVPRDNPLGGNNGYYESLNQIRVRTIPTLKKTGDAGVPRCVNGKFEKQLAIPIQSS